MISTLDHSGGYHRPGDPNNLFTGRRVDFLDSNDLVLQYNRNRYYDYYTGRWLTQDPLGYIDGMSLYEYVDSNPLMYLDSLGRQAFTSAFAPWYSDEPYERPSPPYKFGPSTLRSLKCLKGGCPEGWLDPLPSKGRSGDWHTEMAIPYFISGRLLPWPYALYGLTFRPDHVEFNHESTFARRLAGIDKGFYPWTMDLQRKIRADALKIGERLSPCSCQAFSYSGRSYTHYALTKDDGFDDWSNMINISETKRNTNYSRLMYTARCCVKRGCKEGRDTVEVVCRVRFDLHDKWSVDNSGYWWVGVPFWTIVHFDKLLDETLHIP